MAAEEGQLYFVLNKKLDYDRLNTVIERCEVIRIEHDGEACNVALVGEYKDAFSVEERDQRMENWQQTEGIEITEAYLASEKCMLLNPKLNGRVLYSLRCQFHIVRVYHEKQHRLGIAAGYYVEPEEGRPAGLMAYKITYK